MSEKTEHKGENGTNSKGISTDGQRGSYHVTIVEGNV